MADKKATVKAAPRRSGIIVLTKTQLAYFADGMTKMISYVFPPDVARDMDIVNNELLTTQLKTFITQNKLAPGNVSILLANDILFAREMKAKVPEERKKEVDAFVDLVPFQVPVTKSIVYDAKTYITVASKEYFEAIASIFTQSGFSVRLVLPLYVFAKEIDLKKGVTTSSAASLIRKVDNYRQYNFIEATATEEIEQHSDQKLKLEVKGKSNRKFVIIGVLFMLVGAALAVYLYMTQYSTPLKPQKLSQAEKKQVKVAKQIATPTPGVLGAATTRILLQHNSASQSEADGVSKKLEKKGFENIQSEVAEYFTYNTTVTFANTTSAQIREAVVYELRSDYPDLFILEAASPAAEVVILLAPNTP